MQPLSPIELSFWYQNRFDPVSDANNIAHRLVIAKRIPFAKIQDIFSALSKKHPAFRSNFFEISGVPHRIIKSEYSLDVQNCTGMPTVDAERLIKRPFVLESDSLLRVIYLQDTNCTILYIACPHIIFDAHSWDILEFDLLSLIEDRSVGDSYELIYPSVTENANQYWRSRRLGSAERVKFEVLNDTNSIQAGNMGFIKLPSYDLFSKVEQYTKKNGISMNAFCIATFSVVLAKLTDSSRFIISTPVTTRESSRQDKIGSFINVMPLLIDVKPEDEFISFARSVANDIWEGIEHRNYSLFDIMPHQAERHIDTQGIYNVMIEHSSHISKSSLVTEHKILLNKYAKMDLSVSIIRSGEDYDVIAEFDSGKLSDQYISQILGVFIEVCKATINDGSTPIKLIPLMSRSAEEKLIGIGSGPFMSIENPFVWTRFEHSTTLYPNNIAIIHGRLRITYKELSEKSILYAGRLQELGVIESSVVGLHLPRGIDYIASMLAIWSLGAIYVPLDKSQPAGRLSSMIEQAKVQVIVSDKKDDTVIHAGSWLLTNNEASLQTNTKRKSRVLQKPTDTAYIIFTSGSTGQPKGVMIEHIGFMNHLEIMLNELQLQQSDVVAQSAPVSFDISVWQLICPLIIGASVNIIEHDELIDAERMYKLIKRNNISVLELVPSLLSAYLDTENTVPSLRSGLGNTKIITTGEAITTSVANQWIERYPTHQLINAYGPAEASDDTHFFSITTQSIDSINSIPVGNPLLNIKTFIVGPGMQLLPKGMVGEICIGGIAVSKGYIGQPELTKKAFVEIEIEGAIQKVYRTGDFGKWTNQNTLEYHGRKDQQVKVLGQRIEIGEVENKIKLITGVKDVAVIAVNQNGGTKLKGFVVPSKSNTTIEDIKLALTKGLPSYMIPWKLELLKSLPRNINGKLDRRALQSLKSTTHADTRAGVVLPNKLQSILSIYRDALGKSVNSDSNYFESGGDSIISMIIVSKLDAVGIRVGIRDILLYQTPEELHEYIINKHSKKLSEAMNWPLLGEPVPIQKAYLKKSKEKYIDSGEIQAALIKFDNHTALDTGIVLSGLKQLMLAHYELKPYEYSRPFIETIPRYITNNHKIEAVINELRQKISLEQPLIGCIVIRNKLQYLLLIAHHYTVDFYSWPILQRELDDYIKNHTIPVIRDDILQRWWGKAKHDFSVTNQTREFWNSQLASPEDYTVSQTTEFEISQKLDQGLIGKLQEHSISLESLSYYLITSAYFGTKNSNKFNFQIEATLRGLENSAVLADSVGWMTYTYPQAWMREKFDNVSLDDFHKELSYIKEKSLEYSLMLTLGDKKLQDHTPPSWTINYVGPLVNQENTIQIQKTSIYAELPFIEIDITYTQQCLKFSCSNNVGLDSVFYKSFEHIMTNAAQGLRSKLSSMTTVDIGKDRTRAILERLNDAN